MDEKKDKKEETPEELTVIFAIASLVLGILSIAIDSRRR